MQDAVVDTIKKLDLSDLRMPIITVYRKPKDYPDKYVARVFDIARPTNAVIAKDSLEELQKDITENTRLFFMNRHELDDPCVVGSWI